MRQMVGKVERREFDSFFADSMGYIDEIISSTFQYPELEDDVQALYSAMYGALRDVGQSNLDFAAQAMLCIQCIAATQLPIEERDMDWMTQFSIRLGIDCLHRENLQMAASAI